MKEITVGQFSDAFIPIMDGVTLTVRNYAHWLNRNLGPTCVVAPFVPGHTDRESFSVFRFRSLPTIVRPPYRIGLPGLDRKCKAFLKSRDFSLVHAHTPFGAGLAAARTARDRRIPLIATFHSKYRDDLLRVVPIERIVDRQIRRIVEFYDSVDHVWVPQRAVADTLREYGYEGPVDIVENGIDLRPPESIEPFRRRGSEHLGLPEGIVAGLYVGQHILEKNLEFLIRSLPAVMAAVPEFRMVFVGQGYAKPRLKELAGDLGIRDRILFHDVVHDRGLLQDIYARGDLFLFPSLYDNAPLVVREAAAFKTPAVLLKGSTAAEVIRDGENGFLAEAHPDDFAGRVIAVLGSPEALERAGAGAQRTLCRSWEDVVREVAERYRRILSDWAG
ncbi:MAG TPA: glycosyltransferase [Rectinemataceae bacterium]|nr:glycosyltransferase [Rectinemataceae bacterium]